MTEYGKDVLIQLIRIGRTQTWLASEICTRTGLKVDSSYMNKILNGKRNPARVISAINEILDLGGNENDTSRNR